MKTYIAVVSTENSKIAKYQDFDTQAEANSHVENYGGFTVATPNVGNMDYWVTDSVAKTLTHDSATENSVMTLKNTKAEIHRLESTVTPRRIREMTTADGAKWVDDIEKLIAIERAKF